MWIKLYLIVRQVKVQKSTDFINVLTLVVSDKVFKSNRKWISLEVPCVDGIHNRFSI